jgi:hypothetical protein
MTVFEIKTHRDANNNSMAQAVRQVPNGGLGHSGHHLDDLMRGDGLHQLQDTHENNKKT